MLRAKKGMYIDVHDRLSEQHNEARAQKDKSKKSVLGYMVKRLSAHGGCLGSKRR